MKARNAKIAILAATSLVSASALLSPAQATEFDAAAFPTIEAAPVVDASDHASEDKSAATSGLSMRLALIAAGLGALAGLVRLFGPKKVMKAVQKTAQQTARVSAQAAGVAARSVGRAVRSPLRYLALMAGLILFALTGVGLYEIEWIGGLIAGAAMTGVGFVGAMKMRAALALKPVRARSRDSS